MNPFEIFAYGSPSIPMTTCVLCSVSVDEYGGDCLSVQSNTGVASATAVKAPYARVWDEGGWAFLSWRRRRSIFICLARSSSKWHVPDGKQNITPLCQQLRSESLDA